MKSKMLALTLVLIFVLTSCRSGTTNILPADSGGDIEQGDSQSTLLDLPADGQADIASNSNNKPSSAESMISSYDLYVGTVVINEEQRWKSIFEDGSSGVGNASLISLEYLVVDREKGICYIVARDLIYSSGHIVTINDMNGDYVGTGNINGSGQLAEFYGYGTIIKKEMSVASASAQQTEEFALTFPRNPIRANYKVNLIFTLPPTNNKNWVRYTTTGDSIVLGDARMWPPEESVLKEGSFVLGDGASDQRNYSSQDSQVFEASNRFWNVRGSFSYNFMPISYEEFIKVVEELVDLQFNRDIHEALGSEIGEVWEATGKVVDELANIGEASRSAAEQVDSVLDAASTSKDYGSIESVLKDNPIDSVLSDLDSMIDQFESASEGNSKRNLKSKVESSNPEARESFYLAEIEINRIVSAIKDNVKLLKSIALKLSQDSSISLDSTEIDDLVAKAGNASKALLDNAMLIDQISTIVVESFSLALYSSNADKVLSDMFIGISRGEFRDSSSDADVISGITLPQDFPKIIPIHSSMLPILYDRFDSEKGYGYSVTFKSSLPRNDILSYYRPHLSKGKHFDEFSYGSMTIITSEIEGFLVNIVIDKNNLGGDEPIVVQLVLDPTN